MQAFTELTRKTAATLCLDCGKCTSVCPLAGWDGLAPRRIVQGALDARGTGRRAAARRCLTCAACEDACPQGVRFTEFVRGLRALVPAEREIPCPHAGALRALSRGMAAAPPEHDLSWLDDDLEVAEEGDTALFVGCLPLFDRYFGDEMAVRTVDIARAAVRLLNRLDVRPVILREERCCGHDLLWSGDEESFAALSRANAEAYAARGVRRIVTTCAECCRTWRRDTVRVADGYSPQVVHMSELLAEQLGGDGLELAADGEPRTVTYQDPCRLGRHLGVFDAPRQVLDALPGTRFVEMEQAGRDAPCCGTSGFIHCDAASRRLQDARLRDARSTGAELLVTACPKCLIHFSCAQADDRRRGRDAEPLQIRDLTVLAAERLASSTA